MRSGTTRYAIRSERIVDKQQETKVLLHKTKKHSAPWHSFFMSALLDDAPTVPADAVAHIKAYLIESTKIAFAWEVRGQLFAESRRFVWVKRRFSPKPCKTQFLRPWIRPRLLNAIRIEKRYKIALASKVRAQLFAENRRFV